MKSPKQAFIRKDVNPLIMSLRSGHGVDGLQDVCSVGIVGELDWSPMVLQQCFWRIDREGQRQPVTCFALVTDDGADPPMMEVNGLKAAEASGIVDPYLGVQLVDGDGSHMKALIARYLEAPRSRP